MVASTHGSVMWTSAVPDSQLHLVRSTRMAVTLTARGVTRIWTVTGTAGETSDGPDWQVSHGASTASGVPAHREQPWAAPIEEGIAVDDATAVDAADDDGGASGLAEEETADEDGGAEDDCDPEEKLESKLGPVTIPVRDALLDAVLEVPVKLVPLAVIAA